MLSGVSLLLSGFVNADKECNYCGLVAFLKMLISDDIVDE